MITAFGKKVSREDAYDIIINDYICKIVYSGDSDELVEILSRGWDSLEKWSDGELNVFIDGLDIENQVFVARIDKEKRGGLFDSDS